MKPRLLLAFLFMLSVPLRRTDGVRPPRNVSVVWKSDFEPGLSWLPPHHSTTDCNSDLFFITNPSEENLTVNASPSYTYNIMEGGSMKWSISTLCQEKKSVPVVLTVSYPELVKNVTCYLYSLTQSRCEWLPAFNPPDLKFYYDLVNECPNQSSDPTLVECSSYISNNQSTTGCEIQATACHRIQLLFNGTLNNNPVKNTFVRMLKNNVRLPPLTVTATKNGYKINISWSKPEIRLRDWIFKINYTECGVVQKPISIKKETEYELYTVPSCRYSISVRAESSSGKTPWSEWRHVDAEQTFDVLLYSAIIISIVISVLTAIACACCQKNRRIFFPKVPEPTDFLTDIDDNKLAASRLYIPMKEEEDCKITLVIDPQEMKAESCLIFKNGCQSADPR